MSRTLVSMPRGMEMWRMVNPHFLTTAALSWVLSGPWTLCLALGALLLKRSWSQIAWLLPSRTHRTWDSWPLVLQEKTEHLLLCRGLLRDSIGHRCCLEKNQPCVIFVLPEGRGTLALLLVPLKGTRHSFSRFHSNSALNVCTFDTQSYPASWNRLSCLLLFYYFIWVYLISLIRS